MLKSLEVQMFTFGIRNGNVKELRDMASNPKDEHSYILDSFQEFEALARRALHEGIVYTVWRFTNFSPTQIFREINYSEFRSSKNGLFGNF